MNSEPLLLVVDDQDATRFARVQSLKRSGFRVIEASTGSEALRAAEDERPDLIVLDVNLPDISGLEVARRLKAKEPRAPQILQVSNTATSPADRVSGLEHGADAYLTEPVEVTVLVATIRALLRVRAAELALADSVEREREARKIAENADRLKDEFLATLSHELRTPLNAIMGWIWQLRRSPLNDEARSKALDSIERNTQIQAQLINDLLDVSRAARGLLELEPQVVNLEAVVAGAVDSVRGKAARKHITLQLSASQGVTVTGDPTRLEQVVSNLLTNAVQFTPEEGTVSVSVEADRQDAIVTVRDTGAGIEPSFLPFVFEPFRQGDSGFSRRHGGLGLGLAIVRQLVFLHGGRVAAESPGLGRGATFTVRLPITASA